MDTRSHICLADVHNDRSQSQNVCEATASKSFAEMYSNVCCCAVSDVAHLLGTNRLDGFSKMVVSDFPTDVS